MNIEGFVEDIQKLGAELREESGPADLVHLGRVRAFATACTVVGLGTAWIAPNPLSAVLISTGLFARWTMIGHHVCHRGYDRLDGPAGKTFGEGGRRLLDWFDWLLPGAWKHEHNLLHHYRLNEARDPDLVEENMGWLRESGWPMPVRYAFVFIAALGWKWAYYAPNTIAEWNRADDKRPDLPRNVRSWDPRTVSGRDVWLKSYLPYFGLTFVGLPLLVLPLGAWASFSMLINLVLAELLTNLHSFMVIVPNHAGDDLYRFTEPTSNKGEFFLRQVLGSANFRTGGEVNDFLHGYLNYQIEHHLWPDMSMRAYARAQPRVKAICERHGVPYVQQSVWTRTYKTVRIMVGAETMKVYVAPDRAAA